MLQYYRGKKSGYADFAEKDQPKLRAALRIKHEISVDLEVDGWDYEVVFHAELPENIEGKDLECAVGYQRNKKSGTCRVVRIHPEEEEEQLQS